MDATSAFSGSNAGGDRQGLPAVQLPPFHCSHCPLQHCDCSGALLAKYPIAQLAQQKVPLAVLLQLVTESSSMFGGNFVGGDVHGCPMTSSGSLQVLGGAAAIR
jgi:hypothetical protein